MKVLTGGFHFGDTFPRGFVMIAPEMEPFALNAFQIGGRLSPGGRAEQRRLRGRGCRVRELAPRPLLPLG